MGCSLKLHSDSNITMILKYFKLEKLHNGALRGSWVDVPPPQKQCHHLRNSFALEDKDLISMRRSDLNKNGLRLPGVTKKAFFFFTNVYYADYVSNRFHLRIRCKWDVKVYYQLHCVLISVFI